MQVLADVARQFRKAGVFESPGAARLDAIAAAADALLPGFLAVATEIAGGNLNRARVR
jgi:hypothetical protein